MQQLAQAADLEALLARATELAVVWGTGASTSTTIGQERAILRLFGVGGLDRDGRPLAAEVVDRYLAPDPRRLGGGIALPFAMALAEYDLAPQELALAVAAGNVDLGLEAELLAESDRRAVAMADATALARAAMDRMDANRTARRELLAVLGDPPRPWVGTGLGSAAIVDALDEARAAIDAGAELVRVDVPPSRELADRTARSAAPVPALAGTPVVARRPGHVRPVGPADPERRPARARRPAPVRRRGGRAPSRLRPDHDRRAGAGRAGPGRGGRLRADRHRHRRPDARDRRRAASTRTGPSPTTCSPTGCWRAPGPRSSCRPGRSSWPATSPPACRPIPATRAGRALALQLLAVALARRDGLPADAVVVGAFPDWLVEESDPPARVAAEIALRRALLPGHPLAFVEPPLRHDVASTWHAIVAALLPDAGDTLAVVRRPGSTAAEAAQTRGTTRVAASLRASRETPHLRGTALDHANRVVVAATATLRGLEEGGWTTLVDEPLGMPSGRIGADAVAERSEAFDPIAAGGPGRG